MIRFQSKDYAPTSGKADSVLYSTDIMRIWELLDGLTKLRQGLADEPISLGV